MFIFIYIYIYNINLYTKNIYTKYRNMFIFSKM